MDDKIKEVMGLIEEANYLSEKTRPVSHLLQAIESKLRELVPVWLPIESAEKPAIGANGFGERVLLLVDCGDGTLKSTKIGWWCDKWMMDTGGSVKENGYRAIGWMPLPSRMPYSNPDEAGFLVAQYADAFMAERAKRVNNKS